MTLKRFFRKYGWYYIPGAVFLILNSAMDVIPPRLLGDAVDLMRAMPIDASAVMRTALAMVGVAVLILITRIAWRTFIVGNARRMEMFLREELFRHLQRMSGNFFNHQKTGDLMAFAINDINAIRMTFGPALTMGAMSLLTGAFAVFQMAGTVNARLSLFALLPLPPALLIIALLGSESRRRFRRVQETFAAVSDRVQENISGIRVIKAYAQEDNEVRRFESLNRQMLSTNVDMVKISSASAPVVSLAFGISFTVALIYGSHLVRSGAISLGDFVAFNGYLLLIVNPVQSVARITNVVQRGLASLKRYESVMAVAPDILDAEVNLHPEPLGGQLDVRSLCFRYPGAARDQLQDISFSLKPGKTLGILGRTGSGKSTLIRLLEKLQNPPRGSVFYDGVDIHDISLDVLRRSIGYVPQDNFLFSASVRDNIAFYAPDAGEEEIRGAARKADILSNILGFERGFDTQVGERGMSLSGGQKQRIAIARALIRSPQILILDDSLSAVDAETEDKIWRALDEEFARGTSGILVAHRISALMRCDEILVLEDGRIAQRGTHEELMQQDGFYAQTARIQSVGEEARP